MSRGRRTIIILLESIHDKLESTILSRRPLRSTLRDRARKSVQINKDIDTMRVEGLHARIVIQTRVDVIHTDGVGTQLLHQCSITGTLCTVCAELVALKLVGDALDVPLVSICGEELAAFCYDVLKRGGGRGEQEGEGSEQTEGAGEEAGGGHYDYDYCSEVRLALTVVMIMKEREQRR